MASDAINAWRFDNFASLTEAWTTLSPSLPELKEEAKRLNLPLSAAFVVAWSASSDPLSPVTPTLRHRSSLWEELKRGTSPEMAMKLGHQHSRTSLNLNEWALVVRTGMRLMENMALPSIHVVQQGETLFSIARAHGVSAKCISLLNDVWDDIRPGMHLELPSYAAVQR